MVLLICVQSWWAIYGLRNVREWTFLSFAVELLQVIAIYMQAAFVLPALACDQPVDLHAHYYHHVRWCFGSLVLTLVASLATDLVLGGHLPASANLAFHVVMIMSAVIAAVTRREWYHRANVFAAGAAMTAYIVFLFMRLQQSGAAEWHEKICWSP
ncbi:MAG: hypothetical protein ABIP93_15335 [Gemmatimonadaceae bacterium]